MLQFTIIDAAGTHHPIDEPIGWDAINLHYIRHKDWHGFIDTIDDTMGSLQFFGSGYDILSEAYGADGVEAQCSLLVEFACDDSDTMQTIYDGQFSFYKYKEVQGLNGCHAECSVESGSSIMMLKNRYDQKVNLDSLLTFDQTGASGSSQIEVLSTTLAIPPDYGSGTVNPGDTYLIPNPAGTWGATPGQLAVFSDSGWTYTDPADGQVIIDSSTGTVYMYEESVPGWVVLSSSTLDSYTWLGSQIMLPSYTVEMLDRAEIFADTGERSIDATALESPSNIANVFLIDGEDKRYVITPFGTVSAQDFPDFSGGVGDQKNGYIDNGRGTSYPSDLIEIFTCNPDNPYITNTIQVDMDISGFVTKQNYDGPNLGPDHYLLIDKYCGNCGSDCRVDAVLCVGSDFSNAMSHQIAYATLVNTNLRFQDDDGNKIVLPLSFSYHGPATINPSEKLYLAFFVSSYFDGNFLEINEYKNSGSNLFVGFYSNSVNLSFSQSGDVPDQANSHFIMNATSNKLSYVQLSFATRVAPSPSKVYMVNEAFSRISECVTDDGLKVYSDYFGRTDAQPYTSSADGSGSLECITSGLLIRGQTMATGSHPPITVSMKDLFEAMDAIHQIGMGLEPDSNRSGYKRLRIEPMSYFYGSATMLVCDNVDEITIENSADRVYSAFHSGYSKWEGEKAQGLEEFLTRREYRTSHSTATASLDKSCKFIASGYAIETTRRQLGQNTQDWRFDNDTFVICLKRNNGSYPGWGPLIVEQGAIGAAANINFPSDVYNYRISPIRNAMRWLGTVFQSYAHWASGKLFYTKGAGNVVATGRYTPSPDAHTVVIENKPLIENRDLDYSIFANATAHAPLYSNQTVKFTYPLTYQQWKHITTDPYGLIGYSVNGGDTQYGWIEDLKYSPFEGTADFVLKKKI